MKPRDKKTKNKIDKDEEKFIHGLFSKPCGTNSDLKWTALIIDLII